MWEIRTLLLEEARQSPSLLSDLAGLEQYIAESYDSRSFIELLQNADDADASRFVIEIYNDILVVANDGREFSELDFESLCRSAMSSKRRGKNIGYRGIGFKSVVGFAHTVHILSGKLAATFSRERTLRDIPQAKRVPLIRIPHLLRNEDRDIFNSSVNKLRSNGFNTFFVFQTLKIDTIQNEISAFDPTSLLFLHNIQYVELNGDSHKTITIQRESSSNKIKSALLRSGNTITDWAIIKENDVALAMFREPDGFVKLSEVDAVVHAFLPTVEPTGFGMKIHGDISTDPSRTRVVFDERTADEIEKMADLLVSLVSDTINGKHTLDNANILVPLTDPRLPAFQRRSFKTEFFSAIQRSAQGRFENVRCRPNWLNLQDFETLSYASGLRTTARNLEAVDGFALFLRFLGAKEATLVEITSGLLNSGLTLPGIAEILSHLTHLEATKQIDVQQLNSEWRLWPINGNVLSLTNAQATSDALDQNFLDLLLEKSAGLSGIRRLVSAMSNDVTAKFLIPESPTSVVAVPSKNIDDDQKEIIPVIDHDETTISLKKWRSAEQQVLQLLRKFGWSVNDVSKQNLGFDIEGYTLEGQEVFVEVKSIDFPGQSFTLTTNEEAVARQKGICYQLAIVRQAGNMLEVTFVPDPIKKMQLIRQCRQWAYECSKYPYVPQLFPLD